jgi:hypothetical protein
MPSPKSSFNQRIKDSAVPGLRLLGNPLRVFVRGVLMKVKANQFNGMGQWLYPPTAFTGIHSAGVNRLKGVRSKPMADSMR